MSVKPASRYSTSYSMSTSKTRGHGGKMNGIVATNSSSTRGVACTGQHGQTSPTSAELLKAKLCEFYRCLFNVERILPILNRTSPISLRLLDHFVVNYSAQHVVKYRLNDKEIFDVHQSYDAQLSKYHKTLFDPFRRGAKVTLECKDRDPPIRIETTLAQLCFFRWCIENRILDYIEKHLNAITDNMKQHLQRTGNVFDTMSSTDSSITSTSSRRGSRRRSSGTDVAARRTSLNGNMKYVVSFD